MFANGFEVPPDPPRQKPEKLPVKTEEFLLWLDAYMPHRCPELGDTIEVIHRYAGGRDLIDAMLNRWRNEQECEDPEVGSLIE